MKSNLTIIQKLPLYGSYNNNFVKQNNFLICCSIYNHSNRMNNLFGNTFHFMKVFCSATNFLLENPSLQFFLCKWHLPVVTELFSRLFTTGLTCSTAYFSQLLRMLMPFRLRFTGLRSYLSETVSYGRRQSLLHVLIKIRI